MAPSPRCGCAVARRFVARRHERTSGDTYSQGPLLSLEMAPHLLAVPPMDITRFVSSFLTSALFALVLAFVPARAAAAQLGITWTDNASNEDGFVLERRTTPAGRFQVIVTLGPNATAYLDSTVQSGASYCYRVHAFNQAGVSADSNEGCGTVAGPGTVPLSVRLSQTTYRQNETMVATVGASGGLLPARVDAYVVVQSTGMLWSLQLDGRLVPGLVPIARDVVLPTVSAPFAFPLAGAPPGTYTWLAGVTSPGSLTLLAPIASTTFTVTP